MCTGLEKFVCSVHNPRIYVPPTVLKSTCELREDMLHSPHHFDYRIRHRGEECCVHNNYVREAGYKEINKNLPCCKKIC